MKKVLSQPQNPDLDEKKFKAKFVFGLMKCTLEKAPLYTELTSSWEEYMARTLEFRPLAMQPGEKLCFLIL